MNRQPEANGEEPALQSLDIAGWFQANSDLERSDLQHLLSERLGIGRAMLLSHPDQRISPTAQQRLHSDLQRLRTGEPLGYVLGVQPFRDLTLRVDQRVLLPRPETELLVEQALGLIAQMEDRPTIRVVDLGTGSGAIAVALAHALRGKRALDFSATDCSDAALAVAQSNAALANTSIEFIRSDWFAELSGRFDLIVSNPPYIAEQDPHLAALRHEPQSALQAGFDGLEDLTTIIVNASDYLTRGGVLLVEHGASQGPAVRGLFNSAGFTEVNTERDYSGHERMTCGSRSMTHER
ncbi:MAG: peptide chain release factor N(5)-glutamine methyltransferase [Pseudomonadales bacterium]